MNVTSQADNFISNTTLPVTFLTQPFLSASPEPSTSAVDVSTQLLLNQSSETVASEVDFVKEPPQRSPSETSPFSVDGETETVQKTPFESPPFPDINGETVYESPEISDSEDPFVDPTPSAPIVLKKLKIRARSTKHRSSSSNPYLVPSPNSSHAGSTITSDAEVCIISVGKNEIKI